MAALACFCGKIVNSTIFRNVIFLLILFSAILVGLETYPGIAGPYRQPLHLLDQVVVWLFTLEISLKLLSLWPRPLLFFRDPWNIFDFIIVAICLLPVGDTHFVAVLRLARILRVLRMVRLLPKLQLLIGALLKSIPSMGYVIMLLSLLFYIYGILGFFMFGSRDPLHFGNLHLSLITLFKVLTLEGWTDILNVHLYSEDPGQGTPVEITSIWPFLYFVSFILIGAMIIMNLFIGVIMNSMDDSRREMEQNVNELKEKTSSEELFRSIERKIDELKEDMDQLKKMK